ncbi:MAG: XTP/dITP diphosphatase [Dehalococcoidales bacterium]|nr:XTP/dITP diphosphatase [Dehalococcoidales bacterium]
MTELLLATNNPGKAEEFRSLLAGCGYELVTPAALGLNFEVDEHGQTYEENARLKALAGLNASGLLTLADDSGLEIEALGGEPGIRSSRYAGENTSDKERVDYLLAKLNNVSEDRRKACFRCVIALAWPEGRTDYCEGRCDGTIISTPRGDAGFGYDPVFYFPELGKTMAELPAEIKNSVSHRGLAARKARRLLQSVK